MEYYALLNEKESGSFNLQQLSAMWASGAIPGNTLVWYEGLSEWIPISDIEDDLQPKERRPISRAPAIHHDNNINLKLVLGLFGSAILAVGVFCPLVTVPILGQMNYFQNGKGDGTIILVLSGISAIFCLIRKFSLLWITGVISLALLSYTFLRFQAGLSEARKNLETDLEGNPFGGLASLVVNSVQLQWGFAILAIGSLLVVAAAGIPKKKNP